MKIAVNFRMVQEGNLTGIGFFTAESFRRIVASHPEHTFYFIFDEEIQEKYRTSPNIVLVKTPVKARFRRTLLWAWFEIVLPHTLRKIKPDLFIAPDSIMPLSVKIPALLVIHDLNFEHYPAFMPKGICKFYRKYTPKYIQKARRVAAVSEFTKSDIVQTYGSNAERIDVVYNGYNGGFDPVSDEKRLEVQQKYAQGSPFFVFIGTIHPRKNLINQLKAFDLFRKQNPDAKHKFLLIGTNWIWRSEDKETLEQLKFKEDILFLGRVYDEQLREITAAAEALLFVSVFEGFGIPILEGFYSEIPVITSNVSSMPEIAGDAAICINPFQPQEIADAMTKVVCDTDFRQHLIEKGKEQRSKFSWDKTAALLWESIEKVIG